jgi:hypothetical protein
MATFAHSQQWETLQIKLSLVLATHCVVKTYGRVVTQLYSSLTSSLDGGERGQLHVPTVLLPAEKSTGTQWEGGWVSPRVCLDEVGKGQISCPVESRIPVVQTVS